MVTLSWIVHTRYLLQEPQQIITNPNLTEVTMIDQVHNTTMQTEICEVNPDHNLIFTDIAAQVITIHTEATQDHNIGIIRATTGAAHNAHSPPIMVTVIDLAMTCHINLIADHPHIETLLLPTPEIQ